MYDKGCTVKLKGLEEPDAPYFPLDYKTWKVKKRLKVEPAMLMCLKCWRIKNKYI